MEWRKSQLESNHLNKPVYRSKRKKVKVVINTRKDKHEGVKKRLQNHRMWGRKVRKSRNFFIIVGAYMTLRLKQEDIGRG